MAPGFKTGGRTKGTPNKPRPIILASTEENRELLAMAAVMRTPKAVMLNAMLRFERIGLSLLAGRPGRTHTAADLVPQWLIRSVSVAAGSARSASGQTRKSWPVRAMSGLPLQAAESGHAIIDALGQMRKSLPCNWLPALFAVRGSCDQGGRLSPGGID